MSGQWLFAPPETCGISKQIKSESTKTEPLKSKPMSLEYDIAAYGILCNADKIGARVFVVKDKRTSRDIKILAYDKNHAEVSLDNLQPADYPDRFKRYLKT